MKRRFRKHPQHHAGSNPPTEENVPRSGHVRVGYLWAGFALVILVLVVGYDRRAVNEARGHKASGKNFVAEGLYHEAADEYQQALGNKRLGRRERAEAALALADLNFEHFQDYPEAHKYYVRARQISPSALENKDLQKRMRLAQERANRPGAVSLNRAEDERASTRTVVQHVELIRAPASDDQGPAIVTYRGGEINAGELLRGLERRPEFRDPKFREDPASLKNYVANYLQQKLAYEAGIEAGLARDPDVSTRLYNYQKTIVAERFLAERRASALTVNNEDVDKYYLERNSDFQSSAVATLAFIKTDTESSATEALTALREGASFADVATSFSIDKQSAGKGGVVGTVTSGDRAIPGIGEAPEVVTAVLKMAPGTVSNVSTIGDSWYIFKVVHLEPEKHVSLEQARPRIEQILKGKLVDQAKYGVAEDLQNQFAPQILTENLEKFWQFAGSGAEGVTTGSATTSDTLTTAGVQTTTGTAEVAAP